MKLLILYASFFIALIGLTGCPPANYNEFYFDIENQTLNRCYSDRRFGDDVIVRLHFYESIDNWPRSSSEKYSFWLIIEEDEKGKLKFRDGVRNFDIHNICKDYNFYNFSDDGMTIDNFRLPPNKVFMVTHSAFTEMTPDTLRIKTDSIGRVIYSSKTSCMK